MKTPFLLFIAILGIIVAVINVYEIIKNSNTNGWGVGFGVLTFIVFFVWAILETSNASG